MTALAAQMTNNKTRKKLVFGLGKTGLSCIRHLVQQGSDVIAFDTRKSPPALDDVYKKFPQVEVYLGSIDEKILDSVEQIVTSPGISLQLPLLQAAAKQNIEIVGDIEIFARLAKAPIIAITGSNGKSTTTTLLNDMIKADAKAVKMGGNIGVPALDLLEQDIPDFYILELSSFQLETTHSIKPLVAVVLNVSEDHMDRYENLQAYGESKLAVYAQAQYKVINLDDSWLMSNVTDLKDFVGFTVHEPEAGQYGLRMHEGKEWIAYADERIIKTKKLKLKGRHQVANAIAAVAMGDLCGLSRENMCNVLRKFKGLHHRTEFVAKINGVTYINDSKGTNVGATVAALNGLDEPVVLIAGGEGKGADFTELKLAVKGKVKYAILIGRDAELIEQQIAGLVPVVHAESMEDAVWLSADVAKKGDYVLLSPACASFDMFDNYQQRGEAFMQIVEQVASEAKSSDS